MPAGTGRPSPRPGAGAIIKHGPFWVFSGYGLRPAGRPRAFYPGPARADAGRPILSGLPRLILPASLRPALPAPAPLEAPRVSPSPQTAPAPGAAPSLLEGLSSKVDSADLAQPGAEEALSRKIYGETLEEGEAVYPGLVSLENMAEKDRKLADRRKLLYAAVREVLPALEQSVGLGDWNGPGTTLDKPCCGDASPKLAFLLRAQGMAVNVVEAEFHYYLTQDLEHGRLFVDPSIRQFFGGSRAPPEIPKIFVGSVEDLHALFRRHAAAKTTSYGVERIYFNAARVKNERLRSLEAAVAAPDLSAEHRALLPSPSTH